MLKIFGSYDESMINILHTLLPIGIVMEGMDIFDTYKYYSGPRFLDHPLSYP